MDPFGVLGIEQEFELDIGSVERKHRELSRVLHPDRFASASASERRAALAKAVEVNEAWRIVRDPLSRAEALFSIHGIPVGERNEPSPNPEFLMTMMEFREELSDARERGSSGREKVGLLKARVREQFDARTRELANGFQGKRDLAKLVGILGELRFYRRFLEEVSSIEDEWDEHDGAL